MSLWLWVESVIPTGCNLHIRWVIYRQSEELVHVPILGTPGPPRNRPWPQPAVPTCDRVLNEAQHCAWLFVDVEADGIVLLWNLDDEVGVPIH